MREATRPLRAMSVETVSFNPRLPCGRRLACQQATSKKSRFNPRLPCGRRPPLREATLADLEVSIHASHAGGDWEILQEALEALKFQSTPPMREATIRADGRKHRVLVSIHASHAGGDRGSISSDTQGWCFNPRLPCGRRPRFYRYRIRQEQVSIHASHAGGDATLSPVCS